jgi:hypothetical protein
MPFAALHESAVGTKRTNWAGLIMSVDWVQSGNVRRTVNATRMTQLGLREFKCLSPPCACQ